MIVDDRRENLLALEAVLNSPDYHLISASSGEEALKCLLKDDFAVILLDVQMPGMDGFETASLIRARKRNKDTPIIFITAICQSTENMMQGYSLGAIDYLIKPFHPQTLKLKIEAFVKMYDREMQHEKEQRRLFEKEMAHLDRMNLVGQMAAGIGHEIRNPLTTVRGFLQLLGAKEEFQRFDDYFELMIEELDRANSIITEFLSLAKNKTADLEPLNINTVLEKLFPLIQADAILSGNDIIMDLQDIKVLLLDEKEIRQLILNLVKNGLEAMSGAGKLSIRTFMEDEETVLSVGDEGSGIKDEDLENIGSPFYTTKVSGTGLGLAICYSITTRHNAIIQIKTGPLGTTFLVKFKHH